MKIESRINHLARFLNEPCRPIAHRTIRRREGWCQPKLESKRDRSLDDGAHHQRSDLSSHRLAVREFPEGGVYRGVGNGITAQVRPFRSR
jgi:hypothetical protein